MSADLYPTKFWKSGCGHALDEELLEELLLELDEELLDELLLELDEFDEELELLEDREEELLEDDDEDSAPVLDDEDEELEDVEKSMNKSLVMILRV